MGLQQLQALLHGAHASFQLVLLRHFGACTHVLDALQDNGLAGYVLQHDVDRFLPTQLLGLGQALLFEERHLLHELLHVVVGNGHEPFEALHASLGIHIQRSRQLHADVDGRVARRGGQVARVVEEHVCHEAGLARVRETAVPLLPCDVGVQRTADVASKGHVVRPCKGPHGCKHLADARVHDRVEHLAKLLGSCVLVRRLWVLAFPALGSQLAHHVEALLDVRVRVSKCDRLLHLALEKTLERVFLARVLGQACIGLLRRTTLHHPVLGHELHVEVAGGHHFDPRTEHLVHAHAGAALDEQHHVVHVELAVL